MPSEDEELGRTRTDEPGGQPQPKGLEEPDRVIEWGLDPDKPFDRFIGSIDTSGFTPGAIRSTIRRAKQFGTDTSQWSTLSPTANDPRSIAQAVNTVDRAVDNIGLLNPDMAIGLPVNEAAMALLPEVTAAVQDDMVGPMLIEALFGADWREVTIDESEGWHTEAYEWLADNLEDDAMAVLLLEMSGLEGRFQDSMLSEAIGFLQNTDMTQAGAMDMFVMWSYQRARGKQQEFLQEQTIIGSIGETLSRPLRTSSRVFSEAWASAVSPQDAWYRKYMSPGQNVAISAGQDPGTSGYEYLSGTFDGVWNVAGDPYTYAVNLAIGMRAVKGVPLLAQASKTKLVLNAMTPFWGKRSFEAMGVKASTRGIFNRFGMVIGARTSDQLVQSAKAQKMWKVLAQSDSVGMITQRIPEWKNAPDLVRAIAAETNPDRVQDLVKQALDGAFDGRDNLHAIARADFESATKLFDNDLRRALSTSTPVQPTRNADGVGIIFDGPTRTSVLERAAKFVDEGIEGTHKGDMVTKDGRAATYTSGITPGGEKWTIVKVGDDIVSARIGEMAGTADDFGRQGLYTQILEQQKQQLGLTLDELKQGGSISEAATPVMNRVFGGEDIGLGAVDGLGGYSAKAGVWLDDGAVAVLDGTGGVKVILHESAKVMDMSGKDADKTWDAMWKWVDQVFGTDALTQAHVDSYLTAMGYDAVIGVDGSLKVLTESKVLRGVDSTVPLSDNLIGAFANWSAKNRSNNALTKGQRASTWIVDEMPTGKIPDDIDKFNTIRPKFFSGASNSNRWWARAVKSRVFGKYPPAKISTVDVRQGQLDLTNFLRYVGVKEDDVVRIVGGYVDADFIDRHRYVRAAVQEAAELIDNPVIKHNLVQYVDRGADASYGRVAGAEVLRTSSSVDVSQKVARPFIPSMLSTGVDLPDPKQFAQAHQRYKMAQHMGPSFRRGYISRTQDKRANLVAQVRRTLKEKYKKNFDFTDAELESMAYAVVAGTDGGSDGLGAASHAATAVNRVWSWGVQAFSISQLVGRAMPWYTRVWLDENFRAAFADLPTIMRNPARFLTRHREAMLVRRAGAYRAASIEWAEGALKHFDGVEDVTKLRAMARGIIPNIDDLAKDPWTSPTQARAAIASILNDAAISNNYGQIVAGVSGRRQRLYGRAIEIADEMGFDATKANFVFKDEIPDIANSGFSARLGIMHSSRPLDWTETVTEAGSKQYAGVYHQNLVQFSRDPLIRHVMNVLADGMNGSRTARNPLKILESTGYKRIEPYVAQWAMESGYGTLDRVALLEKYIDEALKPFVREMYAPMMGDDALEAGRVLSSIAETGRVNIVLGDELIELAFDGGAKGDAATAALLDHARTQGFTNGAPPRTLNANMTPFGFMDEATEDWVDAAKKVPSKIFQFMGERMSQTGQRQPSYIDIFMREKKARLALGMPEAAAIDMAHITAGEIVNNIYYNTKAITPFLKSMNKVVPFFTAAWEIAATWAYKIPALQGGMGIGHGMVVRKVDRVVDALRNLGLIEFNEDGQPNLVLDVSAKGMTGPGDEISKVGAHLLQQPLRLAEHFLNMGHALRGSNVDEVGRSDSAVPDKFSFGISSPVDIQSQGIGTAFDIALGQQPVIAFATTNLRKMIPLIAETTTKTATGTFAEFSEEHGVDVFRTLALNLPAIEAAIGKDKAVQLLKGQIGAEDVDLSGVELQVPNTSLWSTLTSDLWFPYGDTDSFGDVAAGFRPSWMSYAWRSFGIWADGNDADGFVGMDQTTATESATNGAILSAARHMNFETGAFEQIDVYREEFYALAQPHLDAGTMEMNGDQLMFNGEVPTNADEVNAAWDKLTYFSDAVWTRIIEDGASQLMMRGMLAAILPGTPRFFYDEERLLDAYYQGKYTDSPFRIVEIDDAMDYVMKWAQDPAGGSALRTFIDNNPTMGPYLVGKTYWGPGGTPPLDRSNEQYFQDLDAGLIKPIPFGAFSVREQIRDNEYNRQIAVQETYGKNPYEVAALTLSDPQAYGELTQEFTQKHHMFLWEDEIRGGEYKAYKDRNREDQFSIREESIRTFNDTMGTISDTIQMMEITPLLNAAERKEGINVLNQMKAGIREFAEEMKIGDKNLDFLSPWQKLRIRWFEEGYVPYLEATQAVYEQINEADTDVELDRLWAELATVNDTLGSRDVIIDGFRFPPPQVFKWNNKDPEVRENDVLKTTTYKTQWLDDDQVSRLIEGNPELGKYLPTTPAQRRIYDQYNEWYDTIEERFQGGAQGGIEQKERDKQRKNLEGQLREVLLREGHGDHLRWMDMWAIQKLNVSGSLPPSLQDSDFIEMVNGIQQVRSADGYKSVGDDDPGRRALTRLLIDRVANDPQFREELVTLGIALYGEELPAAIIPKLFFNDQY